MAWGWPSDSSVSSSLRRGARLWDWIASSIRSCGIRSRTYSSVFTFTLPPRISAGSISRSASHRGQWDFCLISQAKSMRGGSRAGYSSRAANTGLIFRSSYSASSFRRITKPSFSLGPNGTRTRKPGCSGSVSGTA